jgi:hypothetical protein
MEVPAGAAPAPAQAPSSTTVSSLIPEDAKDCAGRRPRAFGPMWPLRVALRCLSTVRNATVGSEEIATTLIAIYMKGLGRLRPPPVSPCSEDKLFAKNLTGPGEWRLSGELRPRA